MSDITFGTIGADPEFFIADGKKIIPAHKLGFKKQDEKQVVGGMSVHRDGWALEINPKPNHCRALMFNSVADFYKSLHRSAAFQKKGYRLLAAPAVKVDLKYMEDSPDDLHQFGCLPSWNAYSEKEELLELSPFNHEWRYAGGHMHISYSTVTTQWAEEKAEAFKFIKMLDRFIALPMTYLTGSPAQAQRRQYYGKAGEFRFQRHPGFYGALEYRTLGPEIFVHPALMGLAFGMMRLLYRDYRKIEPVYSWKQQDQVKDAVNAGVSHEGLLDLVLDVPLLYTKDVLKGVKSTLDKFNLVDVFSNSKYWVEAHEGWCEHLFAWTGMYATGQKSPYWSKNFNARLLPQA